MNAKEARAEAQKVVEQRNKNRKIKAEEKRLADIETAKKEKKDYLFRFKSLLDSFIIDAIKAGKTYCTKELQTGYDYSGNAQKAFKNHPYIKEVMKILEEYKKDGYILEELVTPQEHYSYSENNGSDYDYTTYTASYTVNW